MQGLLKNADIAMYRAKEQGKNNYQFYSAQMNVHTLERLAMESDLRARAGSEMSFLLHYQPRSTTAAAASFGVEALVRWQQSAGCWFRRAVHSAGRGTGLIVTIGMGADDSMRAEQSLAGLQIRGCASR